MRSRVNWAVLGLLLERPSYGYELHQRLARRLPAELLDPTPSHVYAALNVLERRGFIEPLLHAEDEETTRDARRRQPKVHYRATAAGASAFRRWLAEQMRSDPEHAEFVQRVALVAGMRVGRMHELVDAYEAACAREAQALQLTGADGMPARSPDALMQRLMIAARRATLDAHMSWLRYARKEIEAYERGGEADE